MRWPRVVCCGVAVGALTGCASGPSLSPLPSEAPSVAPSPSLSARADRNPVVPAPSTPSQSPTGFPESYAVTCNGKPGVDRVIALLKAKGVVGGSATVTAKEGPLCAGTWQYTVLNVTGQGPLQVVTQGPPTALKLVTYGTEVCSVEVRTQAPFGIRSQAQCADS
jgi:hypothetical protein